MKGKRLLAASLVLCLCLCACSSRDVGVSESSGNLVTSFPGVYRYYDIPGFPSPNTIPLKITYHKVMLGEKFEITDASQIEQIMELLDEVELDGSSVERDDEDELHQVIDFYADAEDEEPLFSLCFLEYAMYIETKEGSSELYPTLNWNNTGTDEESKINLRLGKLIDSWARSESPLLPFEESNEIGEYGEGPATSAKSFNLLDVGVLGHTVDNGPLPTTPAADGDAPLASEYYTPPERWKVCVYDPQQNGYVVHYYDRGMEDTAGQLAKVALQHLYLPEDGIDVASVRIEKSMAVVDLKLTAGSPAEKALQDTAAVETMLHSVATTLNNTHLSHTGFLLNGGQFSLGGVVLEDDGYGGWEATELYNHPIAEEEFAGLRALLPYPGHDELSPPVLLSNAEIQATYPELYALIYYAGDAGEYASHTEIEDEKKAAAGLVIAPDTYECHIKPEQYPLYPADDSFLTPLTLSVQDNQCTPREWVEEAAKSIWGPKVAIEHGDTDIYTYHPKEGVYTPPHRGGAVHVEPYFHSIQKTDDGFSTVVSYFVTSVPGVYVRAEEGWIEVYGDYEEDPRVQELLSEKLPRYHITAARGDDGKLYLLSSKQIDIKQAG